MTIQNAPSSILSTLDQSGRRVWLRPRLSPGRFLTARRLLACFLIVLFFALPWLTLHGHPTVLLDIIHRRFYILGYTFLPTDTILLAILLLIIFVAIFLFTALLGRLWCGWVCPQTIYMEFLYRPLERLFEGTAGHGGSPRAALAGWRKPAFFLAALLVTALPAHTFLAYFVGVDDLRRWITGSPLQHPTAFLVMLATTVLMFFDFYWFREQMCLIACPYGRFQSVLLDKWSLIVSYDKRRGEPRTKLNHALKVLPADIPATTQDSELRTRPATVSTATSASPPAPPASTSAKASRWSASTAPSASTPAMRSWTRSPAPAASSATPRRPRSKGKRSASSDPASCSTRRCCCS